MHLGSSRSQNPGQRRIAGRACAAVLGGDAGASGHADQVGQRGRLHLFHDARAMDLDGLQRRAQARGDLLVGQALAPPGAGLPARGASACARAPRWSAVSEWSASDERLCAIAASTETRRSASSNGLVRKSIAPAFIARTAAGIWPWPLMKTIGRSRALAARASCTSSPLRPGILRSRTRQPGPSCAGRARNSRGDAKVSTSWPAVLSSRARARSIDGSSSTTKTMAPGGSCREAPAARKGAAEGGAASAHVLGPDLSAVGLDDRAADRQAHAEPVGLRRVEGLEDAGSRFGLPETRAGIADRDLTWPSAKLVETLDLALARPCRSATASRPLRTRFRTTCSSCTRSPIDGAGPTDARTGRIDGASQAGLASHDAEHRADDLVQVDRVFGRLFLAQERPNPLDHVAGALVVVDDVAHAGAHSSDPGDGRGSGGVGPPAHSSRIAPRGWPSS